MRRYTLIALMALLLATHARAQTTFASITGLVTDPNGAVIVGATVTVTNLASNYRYTATTNSAGYYTIGQLLEGNYSVDAEAPGFKRYIEKGVKIGNQELRRIDIRLQIGDVATTVEVKGSAALIETEKARISDTKTAETIK